MRETDTGVVPVIHDPFTPLLVGVVTDRDLCLYVVAAGRDPSSSWVDGCMTEDPICCTEHDEVSFALDLMKRHQIRRVPVVNEKHELVGVLSFGDLVRKGDIEPNVVVAALQSICQPGQVLKQGTKRIVTAA
jgi:CBS domain-containing protein